MLRQRPHAVVVAVVALRAVAEAVPRVAALKAAAIGGAVPKAVTIGEALGPKILTVVAPQEEYDQRPG